MSAQFGPTKIGAMQYNGVTIGEAMIDGQIVYRSGPPVVRITATTPQGAFVQFREALAAYGLDSATVEYLPFQLDTSQATDLSWMFVDCLALKTVPPMDLSNVTNTEAMFWSCNALESVPDLVTGNVVNAKNMFQNCVSLTDGNVRLLGRHPNVDTTGMLTNTALTRQPWFNADGTPYYPATGTFNIVNGAGMVTHEMFSHTVVEPGNFTVTVTVESGQTTLYYWALNGEGTTAGTTLTITGLSAGDTIVVATVHTGTLNLSGTWSIVKKESVYADADYYYPLDYTTDSYANRGTKTARLGFMSGSFINRTKHAYLNKATSYIPVTESWSSGWTASAWFQKTGAHSQGTGYLFSRGSAARGAAIYITTAESSNLSWRLDDGSTLLSWTTESNIFPTSGWFHFAVTAEYVAPNYKLRFFVNGTMVRSSTLSSTLNNLVFNSSDWVSFGNTSTDSDYPYEGNIDDMAMWPRKLTDEEVVSIYSQGRSS